MKKNIALNEIPNTLDVNELMGIKGGITIGGNNICIGGSAVKCEGAPAIVKCEAGTSAVTIQPPVEPPVDPVNHQ